MFAELTEPVQVTVRDSFPWVQLVAPLVLATAAFWGAWFAARKANQRQQHQLDHDIRRVELELRESERRVEQELEHDRAMRAADQLRRLLDEAAIDIGVAVDAIFELLRELNSWNRRRVKNPDLRRPESLEAALIEADQRINEVGNDRTRLYLWLEPDHPVPAAHWTITQALSDAYDRAIDYGQSIEADDDEDERDRLSREVVDPDEVGSVRRAFGAACRDWAQKVQPSRPPT